MPMSIIYVGSDVRTKQNNHLSGEGAVCDWGRVFPFMMLPDSFFLTVFRKPLTRPCHVDAKCEFGGCSVVAQTGDALQVAFLER